MARLESLYSNQVSAMASDAIAPGQVSGLAFALAQGQVILNWNEVAVNSDASPITDLGGYRVFRKKLVGDAFAPLADVVAGVETYTDESMKDGSSYIYAVAAFDDEVPEHEGVKSSELAVKTTPSVPTGLVSAAFDNVISLDWNAVTDGEDLELNENLAGYNVYRSEVDGSGYVSIGQTASGVVAFEDTSVVNDVTYHYVVTSFDNSL